ncbi:cupin domain-containing protein [Acidobacteria bacterium AB60]|nr:cupin domain-containing protein [Acidobacteria bacterium AB60]
MISDRILKQLTGLEDAAGQVRRTSSAKEGESVDHTTRPVLMERATYLKKMARASEGSASEILKEYPRHNIQLSVRLRSGIAELHERFADIFIVLDGRATLVTGGTILKPQVTGPGEVRGSMVEGGAQQELRTGDVAHIAAGTPHQILLAGDATFTAMVIKVQETD